MCDKIPRECAEAFIEIKVALASLPDIAIKLNMIHMALFGNGKPSKGYAARVDRLEEAQADVKSHWKTIRKRMIDIAIAVALIYVGTRIGG